MFGLVQGSDSVEFSVLDGICLARVEFLNLGDFGILVLISACFGLEMADFVILVDLVILCDLG